MKTDNILSKVKVNNTVRIKSLHGRSGTVMLKTGLTIFWLKIENSEDNILPAMETENILSKVKVNNTVRIKSLHGRSGTVMLKLAWQYSGKS
jgi:hypothetical protein